MRCAVLMAAWWSCAATSAMACGGQVAISGAVPIDAAAEVEPADVQSGEPSERDDAMAAAFDAGSASDGPLDGSSGDEADVAVETVDSGCGPDPRPCGPATVLFGGYDESGSATFLGDTWEYDGNTWGQRATTGPSPRAEHAMASLNGKVVLFGGGPGTVLGATVSLGTSNAETWEWDGRTWTQRNASGPSARSAHAMATLNGKVVLFGGFEAGRSGPYDDTWEWDGITWAQRMVSGPSARGYHTMTTVNGKVVLFGGIANGGADLGDTWEWDGNAWTQRMVSGPSPRGEHAMATFGGQAIVFGGYDSAGLAPGDTWAWDGSVWTQVATTGPTSRYEPAMAPFNDRVIEFFGGGGAVSGGQIVRWEWSGANWSATRNVFGPSARSGHAMAAR
jgi:hypothetical protein